MREVLHVRQIAGEDRRRWFSSGSMDLVVWYGVDGAITSFQLCYDKLHRERALTWKAGQQGIQHAAVDDGESWPLNYKSTPVLVPDGEWHSDVVRTRFLAEAGALPAGLAEFVSRQLA
jgi:hypothetical protein